MPVLFYDNAITKIMQANVNIVAAMNVCLSNIQFNQSNLTVTDTPIATNTIGVRIPNPTLTLVAGNVLWAGDMATVTATGAAYAANAVFYADVVPRYVVAHYQLSNATVLALNDTFSIFCNEGIANIGDPNN